MTITTTGTFLEQHFSNDPQMAHDAFVAAGREAHYRSIDAKVGSRSRMNHAYGATYWLALHEEVINYVGLVFENAKAVPVAGAPYSLLVNEDGVAILALKILETRSRDGRKRVRSSGLRTSLTSVNKADPNQPMLFDSGQSPDLAEDDLDNTLEHLAYAYKTVADVASTLIIAAFECGSASGLRSVEVGIGPVDDKGYINFTDSQNLDLSGDALAYANPTLVDGDKYHDAPVPKPALRLVGSDGEAADDDGPRGEK